MVKKMKVMKKYFTIIAVSALAFAACQKETLNETTTGAEAGDGTLYTYSLNSMMTEEGQGEDATKMTVAPGVNDRYAKWEEGDAIAAFKEGTNVGTATVETISEDKKYGEFNLTSTAVPGDKVRIIYPSTAEYGKGTLPVDLAIASQTAKLLAYTHAYSDEVTLEQDKALSFSLHHALATVRINYEGGDDWFCEEGTDGSITKVTLSSTKPLSGDYTVNYETGVVTPGEKVNYYVRSNGRTASIKANGAHNYFHFTALPTNGTAEFELRLSVKPKGASTAIEVPFKFKGELKAGKLNVFNLGTLTLDNVSSANDYYAMWLKGETFKIGDLEVNKTAFPTATLAKPDEFTNDNDGYTKYFAGGLLFVDDITSNAVIDMSAATSNRNIATNSKGLVVVGRYKDAGSQAQINVVDMRTKYDVAFLNLRLNLKRNSDSVNPGECIFEKNSNEAVSSALRLVDCYLDVAQATSAGKHTTVAVIRDRAHNSTDTTKVAAPYSKVLVDNCMVKLSSRAGKPGEASCRLYWHMTSGTSSEPNRNVDITNNVIFTENVCLGTTAVSTIWNYTYKDAQGKNVTIAIPSYSPNLSINFSGNTIVGSGAKDGVIYYDSINGALPCKEFNANNNLGYFENCNVCGYTSAKFAQVKTGSAKISGNNNWLGSVNTSKSVGGDVTKFQAWSMIGTNTAGQTVDPFTVKDYVNGYFPIKTDVVKNGAGASYDTKKYCTWE